MKPIHKWRMKVYTHEMVSPCGEVVARLRIAKNYQIALDDPCIAKGISHSGGSSAFGYHVSYNIHERDIFSADDIDGELHYFTGKSYAGNTIRKVS